MKETQCCICHGWFKGQGHKIPEHISKLSKKTGTCCFRCYAMLKLQANSKYGSKGTKNDLR